VNEELEYFAHLTQIFHDGLGAWIPKPQNSVQYGAGFRHLDGGDRCLRIGLGESKHVAENRGRPVSETQTFTRDLTHSLFYLIYGSGLIRRSLNK
jgi:hypothetical protein